MALSPMMQQYMQMKEKYDGCIVLYRLGDFYEMFFDDAVTVSAFLGLTLTGRDCGLPERAPMCGVPYHAVDMYIRKLIEGGFKVAICEQLSDPATSKGMVDRDVIRVITPGTVIEDNILEDKKSNYLMSVYLDNGSFGISWADISTGEYNLYEWKGENPLSALEDFLAAVHPAEIICNTAAKELLSDSPITKTDGFPKLQAGYDWSYTFDTALKALLKQFKVSSLDSFECADKRLAIAAAGALMEYFSATQKRSLSHINKLAYLKDNSFMFLDSNTRRNLEITETIRDRKKKGSLLWLLDETHTNMGGRALRRWLDQPLQNPTDINKRLDAVEELTVNPMLLAELNEGFTRVRDLERLASKVAYGNVNPRDAAAILETLSVLPSIKASAAKTKSKLSVELTKGIGTHKDIYKLLLAALADNPPAVLKDGGVIRDGYNKELDDCRRASTEGKTWLSNLEAAEREETGIKTLKIGYNKVFGYYIEISKSLADKAPFRYQRKQTLTGGERFITPELKEIEEKLLGAEERAIKIEQMLFYEIKDALLNEVAELQGTAGCLASIDALCSLAAVALQNNYCKPVINAKIKHIKIKDGRHPVVEELQTSASFVPNDTILDDGENRTMVITGPNMAGKSTYMRQVAVITLMAHIGSFVPATEAEIALTDRIFTRVGASDDLISGQSTFMTEMIEVATILHNATSRSLLILDEIGRGTSTIDGLSIAWAVMEEIDGKIGAKTLFATHFHELTELEGVLSGVKNYRILIKEIGGTILFLHKIVRGGANKSFGIEVAALAGVTDTVVARAKEIMSRLEEADINKDTNAIMLTSATSKRGKQLSLFENAIESPVVKELRDLNVDSITPLQAFAILIDLKEKAGK